MAWRGERERSWLLQIFWSGRMKVESGSACVMSGGETWWGVGLRLKVMSESWARENEGGEFEFA
jgi:hypothetical protein